MVGDSAWVCDGEHVEALVPALGLGAGGAASDVAGVVDRLEEDPKHGVIVGKEPRIVVTLRNW